MYGELQRVTEQNYIYSITAFFYQPQHHPEVMHYQTVYEVLQELRDEITIMYVDINPFYQSNR